MVREARRLTVREELGINVGLCQEIVTSKLNTHRITGIFIPRLLSNNWKDNRVNISQELLDRASADENFMKIITTRDETWLYGYDVEPKAQCLQWMGKGSPG